MTTAQEFADELREEGLNVHEWPGWETRGGAWQWGQPIATMPHHTAQPVPYPLSDLVGVSTGRIKCNVNVKQNGDIWLVAYEACNYSSGQGSAVVVDEVRNGVVPPATARARNLTDNIGGNRIFFNIEVDHPGDGSPQTAAAQASTAMVHVVAARHYGYNTVAMASHAEFTRRKSDPSWDGGHTAAMDQLRELVDKLTEETDMAHEHTPPAGQIHLWANGVWEKWVARSGTKNDTRGNNFQREDQAWVYDRIDRPMEEAIAVLKIQRLEMQKEINVLKLQVAELEDRPPVVIEPVEDHGHLLHLPAMTGGPVPIPQMD